MNPRRKEGFVSKKITKGVVEIKKGISNCLYLGNLDAKRDWGHSKDYVYAMWLMLQQDEPDDYIIATGKKRRIREFLEKSFEIIGIEIESNGKIGFGEEYIRKDTNEVVVKISPDFFRPSEVYSTVGDFSKAEEKLGWKPEITFEEMIKEMINSELDKIDNYRIERGNK